MPLLKESRSVSIIFFFLIYSSGGRTRLCSKPHQLRAVKRCSWAHRIQAACVPKKAKRRVKTQLSNGVTSAAAVGAPLALVATDGVLEALSVEFLAFLM